MLTLTLVISLMCGLILCFWGYRSFRFAMALAGFVLGAGIGYFLYQLTSGFLFKDGGGFWIYIYMFVGGILLGFLSFRIYKTALFYVTMLFTAYLVIKSYLLYSGGSSNGVTGFILNFLNQGPVSQSADAIANSSVAGDVTLGSGVADVINNMTASGAPLDRFWMVIGLSLLAGIIVGGLVCLFQRPAIIIITAVFGGYLLTQNVFSLVGNAGNFGKLDITNLLSGNSGQPILLTAVFVALSLIGILVQFSTSKKKR